MSKKLPKFITQSQAVKMLETLNQKCATGARNHAILMIMYRAGLRVSEVAKLALPDMDFENRLIYVQGGKGKKDRYVPMTTDLIISCQQWLLFRPQSEFFFCTMKGTILDARYIREMSYRVSENAGAYIQDGREKKKVNPHALRHTCMTDMLREGFNIREVQEVAGHKRVTTTQIYTHVTLDEMAEKFKNRKSVLT